MVSVIKTFKHAHQISLCGLRAMSKIVSEDLFGYVTSPDINTNIKGCNGHFVNRIKTQI